MSELEPNYQDYPIVSVRILIVRPYQLIVSLPDKRKGIIPRREWTWDRSVSAAKPVFMEGIRRDAVILPQVHSSATLYLSFRELKDPWANIHQYPLGAVVKAEVVNIRRTRIYLQLEPGITAVAFNQEIPLLADEVPSDLLVVGDKVRVRIENVNVRSRKIEVSLSAPLLELVASDQEAIENLKGLFQPALAEQLKKMADVIQPVDNAPPKQYTLTLSLGQLNRILLIDDILREGEYVKKLLEDHYHVEVVYAKTSLEAKNQYRENGLFDLVIIDCNLGHQESGFDLGIWILSQQPEQAIAFISNNPLAAMENQRIIAKIPRPIPFAEKPTLDDRVPTYQQGASLFHIIEDLKKGKIEYQNLLQTEQQERFVGAVEKNTLSRLDLHDKFEQLLHDLALETRIDTAMILALEPEKRKIYLLACYPLQRRKTIERALDGLYFSPVRNVIEDKETFYIGGLDATSRRKQLQNFFPEFSFWSSYGMPIKSPDGNPDKALIILDDRADLSWNIILKIRTTASFAALAIERDTLIQALHHIQDKAASGELLGILLHEMNNKLQPLLGFVDEGVKFIKKNKSNEFWEYLEESAEDILKVKEMVHSYGRLALVQRELIDLNDIVDKVYQQLRPYAEERGVELALSTQILPLTPAISRHIEQALINTTLNAIQQVKEQSDRWTQLNDQHGPTALHKHVQIRRYVLLCTRFIPETNTCCVGIMDSGPGVPYHLRERIFEINVSTRKDGHGLGLFISRSLIEAMRGRLEWVESQRFWGSAFAIFFHLPKAT